MTQELRKLKSRLENLMKGTPEYERVTRELKELKSRLGSLVKGTPEYERIARELEDLKNIGKPGRKP